MRRSRPRLAFPRRHEVPGGGHAVHREGQGATASALLRGAEESLNLYDPLMNEILTSRFRTLLFLSDALSSPRALLSV